jgi:hypothetical protein
MRPIGARNNGAPGKADLDTSGGEAQKSLT